MKEPMERLIFDNGQGLFAAPPPLSKKDRAQMEFEESALGYLKVRASSVVRTHVNQTQGDQTQVILLHTLLPEDDPSRSRTSQRPIQLTSQLSHQPTQPCNVLIPCGTPIAGDEAQQEDSKPIKVAVLV